VLLDVHLPDGSGDAIINAVAAERPGVRFLALSVSDAAEDVIAVIRAGARGYVTKTISGEELASAIERVASGDACSPRGWPASSSTRSGQARGWAATPSSTS
jgi:DNA-binding NarL/FixJ family response regulator